MNTNYCGNKDIIFNDLSRQREIKVAVWYPTEGEQEKNLIYLSVFCGKGVHNAKPIPQKHPLVIISHGGKGHRYNQFYLAEHLARHGFIVAAVEHPFDNAFDDSLTYNRQNFLHRPIDIKFVIQHFLQDSFFSNYIDKNKIGIIGHSFGGYTAFATACDFALIKVIILLAPAFVKPLGVENTKALDIPALFIKSGKDESLGNSDLGYLNFLKNKKFINLENAGHYVYLAECPKILKKHSMPWAIDVGINRREIHPLLKQEIEKFLRLHLNLA